MEHAAVAAGHAGPVLVADDHAGAMLPGLVEQELAEAVGSHLHELAGGAATDLAGLLGGAARDDALGAELGEQDDRVGLAQVQSQLVVELVRQIGDAPADACRHLLDAVAAHAVVLVGLGSQAV